MERIATGYRASRRASGTALLCTIGLLLAAGAAVIPTAATAADVPTRKVKVGDLDLATPKGQRIFEHRLRVAIEQVCAPQVSSSAVALALRHSRQQEKCRSSARKGVALQLEQHGLPMLRTASR